jgi:hypothetical protein
MWCLVVIQQWFIFPSLTLLVCPDRSYPGVPQEIGSPINYLSYRVLQRRVIDVQLFVIEGQRKGIFLKSLRCDKCIPPAAFLNSQSPMRIILRRKSKRPGTLRTGYLPIFGGA